MQGGRSRGPRTSPADVHDDSGLWGRGPDSGPLGFDERRAHVSFDSSHLLARVLSPRGAVDAKSRGSGARAEPGRDSPAQPGALAEDALYQVLRRQRIEGNTPGGGRVDDQMSQLWKRGSVAAAVALLAGVALGSFLVLRGGQPRTIMLEDFESGALVTGGRKGRRGWSVAAGPGSGFTASFVPGSAWQFAILTDLRGPGTRILYRDLKLDGRFILRMTVFYASSAGIGFSYPRTLAHCGMEHNEQFRVDLIRPSAPIDSVARRDVLVNVFRTAPGDASLHPIEVRMNVSRLAGHAVRLRLAVAENQAPLLAGVDDIRFVRIGSDSDARIELLETPKPASAIALAAHVRCGRGGDSLGSCRGAPAPVSSPAPCSWPGTGRCCFRTPGAAPTGNPARRTPFGRSSASAR